MCQKISMGLTNYRKKRDFSKTKEPLGKVSVATSTRRGEEAALRFVVQQHDASRMHYDFRLEMGGVFISWAVPKGPSLDPKVRRLAMHVEDHPLEYADFEGTIPAGEYGAGEVIVWDTGEWIPLEPKAPTIQKGTLKFELRGKKLKGAWALVRMKSVDKGDSWLLIKERDEHARLSSEYDVLVEEPRSVFSRRTLKGKNKNDQKD